MVKKLLAASLSLFMIIPALALYQQGVLWQYSTSGTPNSVAVSFDGSYLAVGVQTSAKGGVTMLLSKSGALLWSRAVDRAISSVSISADGSYVSAGGFQLIGISGTYENGAIYYYDRNGTQLWNYTTSPGSFSSFAPPIFTVKLSSDGSRVVANNGYGTLILDNLGRLLWSHGNPTLSHTVASSNASYVAEVDSGSGYAYASNLLELFNSQGKTLWNSTIVRDVVESLTMSQDARYIAVGSGPDGYHGTLYLYNITGSLLWTRHVNSPPLQIAFSQDDHTIVIGTNWGIISYNSQAQPMLNYTQASANSLAVSPDGSYILAGLWADWQQTILVLNRQGSVVWGKPASTIHQIAVSADGLYAVAAAGPSDTGPFTANSATVYFLPGPGTLTTSKGSAYSILYFIPSLIIIPPATALPAIPVASVVGRDVRKRLRNRQAKHPTKTDTSNDTGASTEKSKS
jgi:hypothetical protein